MVKDKKFMITYYFEVIHWQIALYIKMLRDDKFPYQNEYWLESLKEILKERNDYIKKINNYFEPKQLELFD